MESRARIQLNKNVFYYPDIVLGKGSFGTVYKGMCRAEDEYVAVKKIIVPSEKRAVVEKELMIMESLHHPNIVKYWGCEENKGKNESFIIMELCQSGTLESFIKKSEKIPEEQCLLFLKQIVDATAFVNSKNFIHRDLKSENILISKDKKLKICDFGVARVVNPIGTNNMTVGAGTPLNMAPEVISSNNYTKQCDVWSIGIIFYEIFAGKHIFDGADWFVLMDKVSKIKYIGHLEVEGSFNPTFIEIVRRTVTADPAARITIQQLQKWVDQELKKYIDISGGKGGVISEFDITTEAKSLKKKMFKILEEKKIDKEESLPLKKKNISEMERELDRKEWAKSLFQSFIVYVDYRWSRAEFFIDFLKHITELADSPLSKAQKYVLRGLCFAVFLKELEEVKEMFDSSAIALPSEEPIGAEELQSEIKKSYYVYRESSLLHTSDSIKKFSQKLSEISSRLCSEQYQANFRQATQFFKDLIHEIKHASVNKKFSRDKQWFMKQLRRFFYQYQPMKFNLKAIPFNFLKLYWVLVRLCNIQEQFPIKLYHDSNIIGMFKDFYKNSTLEKFIEDLGRMKIKNVQ